jgi:phage-related protein
MPAHKLDDHIARLFHCLRFVLLHYIEKPSQKTPQATLCVSKASPDVGMAK